MDAESQLLALYAAIEQHVRDFLPGVPTVVAWAEVDNRITLPAVLIEVAGLASGADPGTGQTALMIHFEARAVVADEVVGYQQQASWMAAQLMVLLRGQTWLQEQVGPAMNVQAGPDWSKPDLDGYNVWCVEWQQEIRLGQEVWPWDDETGQALHVGVAPGSVQDADVDYVPVGDLQ